MPDLYMPTDELVIDGWLSSCPLLDGVNGGTVLPTDKSTGEIAFARWGGPTFFTVRVSPLSPPPHPIFPSHTPRIVVSCWAAPKKWADAADLAQKIRQETKRNFNGARTVSMPVSGYDTARVLWIQYQGEPSRVEADPNSLARFDITLEMEWIESSWAPLLRI